MITRRSLIKGGLAAGAGLTIGFPFVNGRALAQAPQQTPGVFAPNQWLKKRAIEMVIAEAAGVSKPTAIPEMNVK